MLQIIQNILMAVISGISSAVTEKCLNSILNKGVAKYDTSFISLENTKSIYKQINERVFLSQWTYYYVTILWLYCILTFSYTLIFYYSKYTHHSIQDNFISHVAFDYVRGTITPCSVLFIVVLYRIVNSASIIVELVLKILKKINFNLSKSTEQQMRMRITMFASLVLSLGLSYVIY